MYTAEAWSRSIMLSVRYRAHESPRDGGIATFTIWYSGRN